MNRFFKEHWIFLSGIGVSLLGVFLGGAAFPGREANVNAAAVILTAMLGCYEILKSNARDRELILSAIDAATSDSARTGRALANRLSEVVASAASLQNLDKIDSDGLALVRELARAAARQKTMAVPFPCIAKQIQDFKTSAIARLKDLTNDSMRIDANGWLDVDSQLLAECDGPQLATSYANSNAVWPTKLGLRYWEQTEAKLHQFGSFKCRRVFILDDSEVTNPTELAKLAAIARQQAAAGVSVRMVHVDDLPLPLQEDYAVFNGKVVSLTRLNKTGEITGTEIQWRPERVAEYVKNFEAVVGCSSDVEEFIRHWTQRGTQ